MVDPNVSQISLGFSGDKVTKAADVRFLICGEKNAIQKVSDKKKNIIYSLPGVLSRSSLRLSHRRAVSQTDQQGEVLARSPMSVFAEQF